MSLKQSILNLGFNFGGLTLARVLTRNQPRVFMYHNFSNAQKPGYVSQAHFDWQIKEIKKHFQVMTFLELSQHLLIKNEIPKNAVVITVDDGYLNFYEHAYPVLLKNHVSATLYVTTGFIDKKLWLWPDKLKHILKSTSITDYAGELVGIPFQMRGDFFKDWSYLNDVCLGLEDDTKHSFIAQLALALGVDISEPPPLYSACNWKQLAEMESNGIEIGGHTVTHPCLTRLPEEQCQQEISGSLATINGKLGERLRTFAYPNGQPSDYSPRIAKMVEDAGYLNATTAFYDKHNLSKPFAWRRFDGGKSNMDFLRTLNGVELLGFSLRGIERCEY